MTPFMAVIYSFRFGTVQSHHRWHRVHGGRPDRAGRGAGVVRRNRVPHLHPVGHHHVANHEPEAGGQILTRTQVAFEETPAAVPVKPAPVHGSIAGSGSGGFPLFVNTVAAPAMGSRWTGFLPGVVFGGLLFAVAGIVTIPGLAGYLAVDARYLPVKLFVIAGAVPALVYSLHEVRAARKSSNTDRKVELIGAICEGLGRKK